MGQINILPFKTLGYNFISDPYLPEGKSEYYLRDRQTGLEITGLRNLYAHEIEVLVKNGNKVDKWDNILVTDPFSADLIKNSQFHGLVRIGRMEEKILEHHELCVPCGITSSVVIACDIGDNCALHNVHYLSHYILGNSVILLNVDEMHCSNHAKFGNGIIKQGEDEPVRIWMDLVNEAGGRSVLPFDGMLAADAYLWARYRNDGDLCRKLKEITERTFDSKRGYYGMVGSETVIKNCQIIKDVKFGSCAYIKGANKLKNLTVNSNEGEPSQVGEGVELVNGIVGYGCRVFYGCKAVRFVLGDHSSLKYGARLIHSYLGDNSTISCCEVLNDLIFPAHEQHHNNSFLIASLVMGQSNIAACATIGSNHNSRAPDGEMHAGRGFWPGLCVSLKYNSRFASFVLIARGDYSYELSIPLPFCLVSNDQSSNSLQIMPAYFWLYNLYALARNSWKFENRDNRKQKNQHIEFECLAPDTAEEIFLSLTLLEVWTALFVLKRDGKDAGDLKESDLADMGARLLHDPEFDPGNIEAPADTLEHSTRTVIIRNVKKGYQAYRDMLYYYALKNCVFHMQKNPSMRFKDLENSLSGIRESSWINLGGQLVPESDFRNLVESVKSSRTRTWQDAHTLYDRLWESYPDRKRQHAFSLLKVLHGKQEITHKDWNALLEKYYELQKYMARQTRMTRQKDYENPFRTMVYDSDEEMKAVLGTIENNTFIK
ncbi:MAG: DUF4954 family protein, partial [Spirochaetales bacterium]|nr:DUF4954 family protein [Spirochaetales bacterium]